MKGCRKTVMQKLQDCRKTKAYVVRVPHCSRAFCSILATALRYSTWLPCGSLAADVKQMRGWQTSTSVVRTPWVSCSSLATALCVLRLSYVSQKTQQIEKKMNMSKIRCGSLATLFFVRQSCRVVHNTVRLPYETKKFTVADRCTAAARLM